MTDLGKEAFRLRLIAASLRHLGEQGAPFVSAEAFPVLDRHATEMEQIAQRITKREVENSADQ